jgi:excisionase family DNA binding protein
MVTYRDHHGNVAHSGPFPFQVEPIEQGLRLAALDAPPFSVETLAARWGVSGKSIRHMIQRGEISAFRLGGKLLRIPASEVARVENGGIGQCQNSSSSASTESSSSCGTTSKAGDIAARSARLIGKSQRQPSSSSNVHTLQPRPDRP